MKFRGDLDDAAGGGRVHQFHMALLAGEAESLSEPPVGLSAFQRPTLPQTVESGVGGPPSLVRCGIRERMQTPSPQSATTKLQTVLRGDAFWRPAAVRTAYLDLSHWLRRDRG